MGCAILGIDIKYATPEGFEPDPDIIMRAQKIAEESGSKIQGCNSAEEAVKGAGVVYTDVFVSMGENSGGLQGLFRIGCLKGVV